MVDGNSLRRSLAKSDDEIFWKKWLDTLSAAERFLGWIVAQSEKTRYQWMGGFSKGWIPGNGQSVLRGAGEHSDGRRKMHMTYQDGNNISEEVANADDMMRQWPKSDLLLFCGFPKLARKSLCRSYWGKTDTLTLAEVFEIVITSEEDQHPGYLISKMLGLGYIGKKTFLSVVNSMACLYFGKQCNLAWKSKHTKFLNAHRVKKGSRKYCWSFPITDEDKLFVKFRSNTPFLPRRRKKAANKA